MKRNSRCLEIMVRLGACAFLLPVMSGCGTVQLFSPDALDAVRPSDRIAHSFFIESVEGKIWAGQAELRPDFSEINKALEAHYPSIFNKHSGAVPLHIAYSGRIPVDNGKFPRALLNNRTQTGGKLRVSLQVDNSGDKRVAHIPYRISGPCIMYFDSLGSSFVPANSGYEWEEVKALGESSSAVAEARSWTAQLIAAGVLKALNNATPEQMAKLVGQSHRTAEQRRLVAWLAKTPTLTFSVNENGELFTEAEHKFTPVPTDFAELRKLPTILMQDFDSKTRAGKLVADITGCDEHVAIDYLLGRLVPEICRTKSVVFDPVMAPPSGAMYKINSYGRKVMDGKDIVQVVFASLK